MADEQRGLPLSEMVRDLLKLKQLRRIRTAAEFAAEFESFKQRYGVAPENEFKCETCQDTGFTRGLDKNGYWGRIRCACQPPEPLSIEHCPPDERASTLANFTVSLETTHAFEAAKEFAAGKRQHLFVTGPTGRGKTRLALSSVRAFADQGITCTFVSMPWLLRLLQRGIDDAQKLAEGRALEDAALYRPVIVLDDLGAGNKGSDFVRDIVTRIVDRRHSHRLRTAITSNFDLPRLATFFDDTRVVSRIAHMVGETYELGGRDWRLVGRTPARRGGADIRVVK